MQAVSLTMGGQVAVVRLVCNGVRLFILVVRWAKWGRVPCHWLTFIIVMSLVCPQWRTV
jgi:hypothetical protein